MEKEKKSRVSQSPDECVRLPDWSELSQADDSFPLTLDWLSIINSVFANIFPHPPTSLPQRRSSAAERFGLSPKL